MLDIIDGHTHVPMARLLAQHIYTRTFYLFIPRQFLFSRYGIPAAVGFLGPGQALRHPGLSHPDADNRNRQTSLSQR
jgi:hypothetical protein